ncbi:MAG TPA: hypothetical protein VM096_18500 [Vicinamibacterales bacterium]|nr:hypothetical protein [Vicinamibacterales bacterium]
MDYERDDTYDAISVRHCREFLGEEAAGLSDEEVEQLRQHADALAHVIIDVFLEQRPTPQ